jgi:hypothetical protein
MSQQSINNGSTIEEEKNGGYKIAVNSIQRTLFVERLYVNIAFPADRIIPYDKDNLYPQKIKSIAQRSGTTMSAIETLASFTIGQGFQGSETIVNEDSQTLWDILLFIAFQKSMFRGFVLHFNYNIFGQITEINPINFEFVRYSKDLKQFVVNPDWARRNLRNREITYEMFNPDNVFNEIQACEGIENYKGQIYYWIPNKSDYYTTCRWDSVLDDAQFEAESKLYSLSSIQNDYSLSGIVSFPKNLVDQKEINETKEDLQGDTGAKNAGGIRVVSAMPSESLTNWKWFTPISRNNIDSLHKNQIETAKFNIYAAFRQPPILNGVATSGMFNQESFVDAFNYYNAQTETDRNEIEIELSKILQKSIWANIVPKIEPKKYQENRSQLTPEEINQKSLETRETAQANLKGTVGGVDGILAIKESVRTGSSTTESAISLLIEIFGLSEEVATKMIGQPNVLTSANNG